MENQWKQLVGKLKQAGEDVRQETQRLVEDLRDPKKQEKVKESLRELGTWAKNTAEEGAKKLESAVKALEIKVQRASEKVSERIGRTAAIAAGAEAKVPRMMRKKISAKKTPSKKRSTPTAAKIRRKRPST